MTVLPISAEQSPSETRQAARLADSPELYRKAHERLAVDLALKVDEPEAVFAQYGYSPEQAADLLESPAFLVLLQQTSKDLLENGVSFRTKAKVLANDLLPYAHAIATDPEQSAAVRADLVKWSAKVAGFEPREKEEGKIGGGFTLSITFAGQEPQKVISSHEPVTIEQEVS